MGDRVALVCAGPASEGRQRTSAAVALRLSDALRTVS